MKYLNQLKSWQETIQILRLIIGVQLFGDVCSSMHQKLPRKAIPQTRMDVAFVKIQSRQIQYNCLDRATPTASKMFSHQFKRCASFSPAKIKPLLASIVQYLE